MELKAKELRIGNLVQIVKYWKDFYDENYFIPKEINLDDLRAINNFKDIAKPIPLTEEWLLKFGFGKSDEHEYGSNEHDLFGFYYDYHFNKFYLDTPEDNIYIPFIKYVHQLQNLYHCLCGNELQINSTKTTR